MNDLVSVIMPCYNCSSTIARSIESVQAQTYSNWELLITDDCSSDNTLEIVRKKAVNDERIRLFALSANGGAGAARNNSINKAQGRFIAFLDADDSWIEKKLEVQIAFMKANCLALTYSAYQKVKRGSPAGVVEPPVQINYQQLVYGNVIGCLTAVYDVSVLGKRYMPLIRKRQDMGLWLDILKDIPCAKAAPGVLAFYNCDTGMTKNKLTVLGYQWKFYREVVGLGFLSTIRAFVIYAYKGYKKNSI